MLIYVDSVPPPRMPFVLTQTGALKNFDPYFVAVRRIKERLQKLPAARALAINSNSGVLGKIREFPFRRFGFAPVFQRRLRRLHPVLVHAHSGFAAVDALALAERLQVPLLTTIHGRDVTVDIPEKGASYDQRRYRRRRSLLAKVGCCFIAVSRFTRDKMIELGFPKERIVVHYTGVDVDFFAPDPAIRREPIALFVGRLDEMKGCEGAISAMARVQSAMPEVEFVIIGEGSLRSQLEKIASKDLRRYKFLGSQPSEVVRYWMNRALILVVPSVTASTGETETFGMVFAEAQAMQLPTVSFASGGIPEVVVHGETGLLAKERDWDALASNIETLCQNESMRLRMGEAGRLRTCALFNLKNQTVILEGIYRRISDASASALDERSLCHHG